MLQIQSRYPNGLFNPIRGLQCALLRSEVQLSDISRDNMS